MEQLIFVYNRSKLIKIAWRLLGLGTVGAGIALYMWLLADPVNLLALVGGVFLALLGIFVFIKIMFVGVKKDEKALFMSMAGIQATTTPVAKAAGLIVWDDIESIAITPQFLDIKVKDVSKYAERMNSFFVRDTFLKMLKGSIRISIMEVDATYNDLFEGLQTYTRNTKVQMNS